MSRHTLGPWEFDVYDTGNIAISSSDGVHVASLHRGSDAFANARLIAAAPDLLAALKAAQGNGIDDEPSVWGQIAEAIAKAEPSP